MQEQVQGPERQYLALPKGTITQIWDLYGLKRRDTLGALFGLPAAVQVLAHLYEQMHLAELVRRFIEVWREATRALWQELIAFINSYISWDLNFTPSELDALTLTALAGGATISSLLTRRGESLPRLAERAREGEYRRAVRLLQYPLLITLFLVTLVIFMRTAHVDFGAGNKALMYVGAPLLLFTLAAFSAWWAGANCVNSIERALVAARAKRYNLFAHFLAQLQCADKRKKALLVEIVGTPRPLDSPDANKLLGIEEQDVETLTQILELELPNAKGKRALAFGLFMISALIAAVVAFVYMIQIVERPESVLVYFVAISALSACIWVNWKAFPIIYVNCIVLVLSNLAVIHAIPIAQQLERLIDNVGG